MLQINTFCNLSKMNIFKSYEQMWLKTFNLTTLIFVEVLNVMGSPCEFSPNLQKWVRASINLTKVLLDQFAIKLLNSRGVFAKCPSSSLWRQ